MCIILHGQTTHVNLLNTVYIYVGRLVVVLVLRFIALEGLVIHNKGRSRGG